MPSEMNTSIVEQALARLGQVFKYERDVEILLVGGAAGMLTGVLAQARTTTDCDVMVSDPAGAIGELEAAARTVAASLELAPDWFNSHVQLRLDALPDGWRNRRAWVGSYGRVQVWAASRVDLIAMKVLAGRAQDLEALEELKVLQEDIEFTRAYLENLHKKGTQQQQIDDAMDLLESLEPQQP